MHAFEMSNFTEIERHLAFRDYMREYAEEKV
ncbi:GrpB family protein [Listeria grandensis]|nr:GrpB family protein [Listeria grandensis]